MTYNNFQIGDIIKSFDFHMYDSHLVGQITDKKNGYYTLKLIEAIDHNGKGYFEEVKDQTFATPYGTILMDKFFDQIGKERIVKIS